MRRIRTGDTVVVISGEDKGKRGKVMRVLHEQKKVVLEGINQVKRHMRATPQSPGGILEVEAPLPESKVMLVDPESDKPTRVKYQTKDDKKVRVAKSGDDDRYARGSAMTEAAENIPAPRLREKYKAELVPVLMKRFSYTNQMQVPRISKIVVNMGLGEAVANPEDHRLGAGGARGNQRPEARRDPLQESDCELQAA